MDLAHGNDSASVNAQVPLSDSIHATTMWTIRRYDSDAALWMAERGVAEPQPSDFNLFHVRPYSVTEIVGNLITNAGWTRLMNLLTNQGATQALDATHARIGVGNSNTAEAYTDTDLGASAGSANRWFQLVSGAGSLGTRTLAFSGSFGSSDGNFAWNEFGLDFGTASGNTVTAPLFNHKAGIAQGTKAAGQVWTATATITFS